MKTSIKSRAQSKPAIELLPFHPLADLFPLMEAREFDELVGDIERRGLQFEITIFDGAIIDGRNRARACAKAGIEPRYMDFAGTEEEVPRFIISANIHRRHLKPEQRSELIKKVLGLDPARSDRAIATDLKVDKNVVSRARRQLEATGAAAPVEKRTGKDGKARKQPARPDNGQDVELVNGTLISPTALPPQGRAALELITPPAQTVTNGSAPELNDGGGYPQPVNGEIISPSEFDADLITAIENALDVLSRSLIFRARHRQAAEAVKGDLTRALHRVRDAQRQQIPAPAGDQGGVTDQTMKGVKQCLKLMCPHSMRTTDLTRCPRPIKSSSVPD
jgi:hypothetical protein